MMRHRNGICAPDTFWNATPTLRAQICNGAGPAGVGFVGWLVAFLIPDTLWGLCITPAANVHDWMYWEGLDSADKKDADRIFLLNMIALIEEQTTRLFVVGFVLRELRRFRALLYYMMVVEFGAKAYWTGKKATKGNVA